MFFLSVHSFCSDALGSSGLMIFSQEPSAVQRLEFTQHKNSESQTVQMQSESPSLWFCLVGFDPFDSFRLIGE